MRSRASAAVGASVTRKPFSRQIGPQQFADAPVIVDDQDMRQLVHARRSCTRRSMRLFEPFAHRRRGSPD